MISQGPIDQLLNSDGKTIYNVALKGELTAVQARVARQPWVEQISPRSHNGQTAWQIALSDETTTVTAFGRKKVELEEAFISLVQGGNHEQQR